MTKQEKIHRLDVFSSRLASLIKASGLKQKEIAKIVGVSEITLSRYRNGIQTPTNATVNMLASVLKVSPAWLMGFSSESPIPENSEPTTDSDQTDWKRRALAAEERLQRIETILHELFAFAHIGQ